MRDREPDEQIASLVAQFFAEPSVTEAEYEITLRNVAAEMEVA
jgi:hypothetical protein